jgi:hypothetical protein
MKKYILTENQIKNLVDNLMLSESVLKESNEVYNLVELAEVLGRTGWDEESLLLALQDVYKGGGDDGVINLVKLGTGIDIKAVSKGHYVFRLT